jgi:cytidylate kinase
MPDADYKFFLIVSDEEAAKRRFKEYQEKGIDTTYEEVLANVKERNKIDSSREVAPLKAADDAIVVDTSSLNQFEVVEEILGKINEN